MESTVTVGKLRAMLRRLERLGRQLARVQAKYAEARAEMLRRNAARARAIFVQGV